MERDRNKPVTIFYDEGNSVEDEFWVVFKEDKLIFYGHTPESHVDIKDRLGFIDRFLKNYDSYRKNEHERRRKEVVHDMPCKYVD